MSQHESLCAHETDPRASFRAHRSEPRGFCGKDLWRFRPQLLLERFDHRFDGSGYLSDGERRRKCKGLFPPLRRGFHHVWVEFPDRTKGALFHANSTRFITDVSKGDHAIAKRKRVRRVAGHFGEMAGFFFGKRHCDLSLRQPNKGRPRTPSNARLPRWVVLTSAIRYRRKSNFRGVGAFEERFLVRGTIGARLVFIRSGDTWPSPGFTRYAIM